MGYRNTKECIEDLEKHGHVLRISEEVDPHLEMAEIQRRIYQAGGPAILFEKVKGTSFPCVSNCLDHPNAPALFFAIPMRKSVPWWPLKRIRPGC